MLVAGKIEASTDLLDEIGGDAPTLRRRVETNAPEAIAKGVCHAQRLFRLVLEGVDQGDARDIGLDVPVEGFHGPHRVTEDEHHGVRHGARRRETCQPRSGRRGGTDAAADHAGVVHLVGDRRMDVTGPEADHRNGRGGIHDASRGGRPAGRLRQDPQDRRLVQPKRRVARVDAHHHLLGGDGVAVVQ